MQVEFIDLRAQGLETRGATVSRRPVRSGFVLASHKDRNGRGKRNFNKMYRRVGRPSTKAAHRGGW
ncbi:hypothetical protein FRUB_07473 [Fimbriiglobus ruber]|uniref:Uncharacterized protein n=1 Tax=Fimbriiglobus ruber TaxID=1908690 RepID=A0A225DBI8_9BACT|nr:hypothetical protein FRUB_07473 [Fimbriiglobus ruber]